MNAPAPSSTASRAERLLFAAASAGTQEFAGLFREVILRYALPLTAAFVACYLAIASYVGTAVSPLNYVLLAVCGAAIGLMRAGRHTLAVRMFLLAGLGLVTLLNVPELGRPSGFATGGCYLFCLYPVTWWLCFPERVTRLGVLAYSVIALCAIAAAGQSAGVHAGVPEISVALALARSLFFVAVTMAFCHAFEIAVARLDDRWRVGYAEQEALGRQLRNHARDLAREGEAHRETLRHLSRSETRLRYLFDHAFDGIVVFDGESGRPREINERFAELLGYSVGELMGYSPLDLSPDRQPDGRSSAQARAQLLARLERRETVTYDWTYVDAAGREVDFEVTTFPVPGEALIHFSVFRDVTARNRATAELEAANRELRTFAHAASHDLKEPLRTMSNFAKLLGKRYRDVVDDAGREYIGFITDAAQRGTTLVHDLLAYAEVGTDDVATEPTSLALAAATVRQNVAARLEEVGATLAIDDLPTVIATPTWAQQLLQNLISNALKFTREGVAPRVAVSCASDAYGHTVRVSDNGIGIAPEDLERVFGVFERLVRRDQYEGNGIGLALCRRIVERLGGEIHVESVLGEGTTFVVWFPACDPPGAPGVPVATEFGAALPALRR